MPKPMFKPTLETRSFELSRMIEIAKKDQAAYP